MEVTSNTSTEDQIREALEFPTAADEASEAASKLGKRGGKAAAEARKSKQDDKDEPTADSEKATKAPEKSEGKKVEAKDEEKPEEKPEPDKKKGNPRHDPEARKAEISAEIRELTEKRNALRREVERPEPQARQERSDKPDKSEKPDWTRYEAEGRSFQEFLDDSNAHAVKEGIKKYEAERQAREKHERVRIEARQFISSYEQRMNAYAEKNGGQEFLDSLDQELLQIPPRRVVSPDQVRPEHFIVEEVIASESAPQLWAYFSENRQEFQRLATLEPLEIIRGIAKLAASLESPKAAATAGNPAPKAPEVSQAKPPVRPVTGSPHTADDDDDLDALAKLPLNRYVAVMNAKERRAQR